MLRVRVLGSLAVEDDGRALVVPPGRPQQLVAYLALHPGPHPRRHVAAELWPDSSADLSGHRLRTALWEVHSALAGSNAALVQANRASLGLDDDVRVDLFEARRLLDEGASRAAATLLRPGLAADLDREWAEQPRADARSWLLEALEVAVRDVSDPATATALARQRVGLDPLSEAAHGDLIRLLAGSGDRGAAMAAYERMRTTLEAELGVGPSAASRRLLADLGTEDASFALRGDAAPRTPRRVPAALTTLLGRDADVALITSAVGTGRLVTIVGPGGVGKSRVAFAVAQQQADRGRPVAVAELATTAWAGACEFVVSAALGVQGGPGRAVRDAVVDRLEAERGLLVLDNCEHLLPSVRELVSHLLRWSTSATVLATSREQLGLPGEHVVRLLPLPVPSEDDHEDRILASPAVQLLSGSTQREGSHPRQPHGAAELARLARRLDGLPLALELAAARLPSLGAGVLSDRLSAGLDVVSTGGAVAGRQASLVDTLEWSMTMLSPQERRLLGLLSLLPGPFPVTVVETMTTAAGLTTDPVVGLARLVEASLVQVHPEEVWCYSALETIRTFGSRLLDDGTAAGARRGLVQWAAQFADDVRSMELAAEGRVHAEMLRFLPLVRAALEEARHRGDLAAQRRIITGVEGWGTWREQPEVWAWVSDLAAREPAEQADADVLRMGAVAAWRLGQLPLMRSFTARCVAADPRGERGAVAAAALMLLAYAERRWADAAEVAGPARALGGADGAVASTVVASALVRAGRPEAARAAARDARREADLLGAPTVLALALLSQAGTAAHSPEEVGHEDAQSLLTQARLLAESVGSSELVASIDKERGRQALRRGCPQDAVGPLRAASLHWLGTGNAGPLERAVDWLAESLALTGSGDAGRRLRADALNGALTSARLKTLLDGHGTAVPGNS